MPVPARMIARWWARHRNHLGRLAHGLVFGIAMLIAPLALAGPEQDQAEFFAALPSDNVHTVRKLLVRGVSPNLVHPEQGPVIVMAAQAKAFGALRALLDSRITEVNVVNPKGETALMYLAMFGEIDLARMLIGRGAQVNQPGWTALHYAAATGQLGMIRFLVEEQHAYIDAASANGTTPLMMAAREGQVRAARLLAELGADPSLRNQAGLGAPEYFLRRDQPDEARYLADKASEFLRRYGTRESPVPAATRP
ncbi:MAG: ankyrin repeat domain-containing protein [Burkholderiales bacterium]